LHIFSDIQRLNCRRNELLEKKTSIKDQKRLNRKRQLETRDWSGENFNWSKPVRRALRDVFGLSEFRPKQLESINAIMYQHDVLLLAPTGGGKSLCFQLPAVVSDGLTLVVSPLLSLMEDQVWSLKSHDIPAEILCSTTDKDKANSILKQLTGSEECNIKLLYVTPERIAKSKRFMTALQKLYQAKKLDRFAIDEVHCVSQWGHDFRPDFKFLSNLKNIFPEVPILGVTATATAKVLIDVQKILNIRDCVVFNAPFNRKNLYYHIMEKPSDKSEVCDLLADLLLVRYAKQSGIIYTFSIKDAEDLANELLKRDVKVRPYHANLDAPERTKVHSKWLKNDIQAVVATVAFGMGIDKSNCRFVIHHTISKSMENFYQESGRAGRDGEK
jgi:ATP-dependent DNA helicase Q1